MTSAIRLTLLLCLTVWAIALCARVDHVTEQLELVNERVAKLNLQVEGHRSQLTELINKK